MGDYANDVIDAIMDDPTTYYGIRPSYKAPKPPVCRRCGEKYLTWEYTSEGWRLYEFLSTGPSPTEYEVVPHNCKMSFKRA